MRPSELLRDLIDRHYRAWWMQGTQLTPEQEAQMIARLADTNDPSDVPTLVGLLYSRERAVAAAAAGAIQTIVDASSPVRLARLDAAVRETSEWRLPRLNPLDMLRFAFGHVGTLGVLSFHRSGYVREPAINTLAKVHDGRELPFLLIRVNDWVEPVREATLRALMPRIRPDYVPHFVRSLSLVYRLIEQRRGEHGRTVEAILAILRRPEARPALREALSGADRDTRRLVFPLLLGTSAYDVADVLNAALASDDTALRLAAARETRARLDGERLLEALARLANDSFMPVRREALYGFAEQAPAAAPERLRAALTDPHVSMREAARFYLRKLGESDFADRYRQGRRLPERITCDPGRGVPSPMARQSESFNRASHPRATGEARRDPRRTRGGTG